MSQIGSDKQVVIGVHTDTALDGIDICVVEILHINKDNDQWSKKLIDFQVCNYSEELRAKILKILKEYSKEQTKIPKQTLDELDQEFTTFLLENISPLKQKYPEVTLISISGLLLQLIEKEQKQATFLTNCGQQIANEFKTKVVCNFQAYDFFLKGNGGPFQVIGNAKLSNNVKANLHVSGYASFTSFQNKDDFDSYFGQFICPAMFAINYAVQWNQVLLEQQGKSDEGFLNQLKSIGQSYNTTTMSAIMKIIDESQLSAADKVATIIEYIVANIKRVLEKPGTISVSGCFSDQLYNEITKQIGTEQFTQIENFRETDSMITAFLAVRKIKSLPNSFKNVTQAKSDHSCGIIYIQQDKPLVAQKKIEFKAPQETKSRLANSEDYDFIPIALVDTTQRVRPLFQTQHSLLKK